MVFLAGDSILLHVIVVLAFLFITSVSVCIFPGSDWPSGWYGLPRPKSGCPSSSGWDSGYWLEDRRLNNQSTSRVRQYSHLKGTFTQQNTKRYFCMKKKDNGLNIPWPDGQYCIYQSLLKPCPPGFINGSIGWKNKDAPNDNCQSGKVPSGVFASSTRFNYCCKVNGPKENSISLPIKKPFLLLAYNSSQCQSVKWARTTQEYLQFSVQEDMTYRGFHPFVDDNYALRYCYYTRSNQTLTTPNGIVSRYLNQTSLHQERYSAWHIKPRYSIPSQFLVLRFSRFIFHASNITSYLQVFDGHNESAPSLGRFSSTQSPLSQDITSITSQLFVALSFGDRSGMYDFEFNYHIIPKMTTVATTFASSSVTSRPHTSSGTVTSSKPYTVSSSVTSQSHTSYENVTSSPFTDLGYLRYHGNNRRRKLLLSIILPIGLLVVMALVLIVVFIRRRQRRRRYSRMDDSVYDDEQGEMDGYFEEIQLSPACSLLHLTIQPVEEPRIRNHGSDQSWTSEQELFDRQQHDFPLETESHTDPSASPSESYPDPTLSCSLRGGSEGLRRGFLPRYELFATEEEGTDPKEAESMV